MWTRRGGGDFFTGCKLWWRCNVVVVVVSKGEHMCYYE